MHSLLLVFLYPPDLGLCGTSGTALVILVFYTVNLEGIPTPNIPVYDPGPMD